MGALLDLFESVAIESSDLLPSQDVSVLSLIEQDYLAVKNQLESSLSLVREHSNEFTYLTDLQDKSFKEYQFSPGAVRADIESKLNRLRRHFVDKVVSYLNETYNLNLTGDKALSCNSLDEMIPLLLEGSSEGFYDKGVKRTFFNLRKIININEVKLKNNVITFGRIKLNNHEFHIVSNWNDSYRALMAACGFAETGRPGQCLAHTACFNGELKEFGKIQTTGKVITQFQLFKSYRLDVHFSSSEKAFDFYNRLNSAV